MGWSRSACLPGGPLSRVLPCLPGFFVSSLATELLILWAAYSEPEKLK